MDKEKSCSNNDIEQLNKEIRILRIRVKMANWFITGLAILIGAITAVLWH